MINGTSSFYLCDLWIHLSMSAGAQAPSDIGQRSLLLSILHQCPLLIKHSYGCWPIQFHDLPLKVVMGRITITIQFHDLLMIYHLVMVFHKLCSVKLRCCAFPKNYVPVAMPSSEGSSTHSAGSNVATPFWWSCLWRKNTPFCEQQFFLPKT